MKVRPKKYFILTISNFMGDAKVYINCYPQQKWNCVIKGNEVYLGYKQIYLVIPKEDFEKYWMEV